MRTVAPHDPIKAEDFNALVAEVRRNTPNEGPLPPSPAVDSHPWQCSVAAGATDGQWKVTMLPGWINDTEARVAYLTQNDPRTWDLPVDYPSSLISGGVAERSWRETIDPPYLLLTASKDFIPVPDAGRPQVFCTADALPKTLTVANVFLCALPWSILNNRIVPSMYRTWAGKLPTSDTYPYGLRVLALVYLLTGDTPSDAQAFVQQKEFENLMAVGVDPITILPDYQPIVQSFGGIGDGLADSALSAYNTLGSLLTNEVNAALANLAEETSSVEFWTV